MATILEFNNVPRPTSVPAVIADGTAYSAEIVLFPGIRYERHADAAAEEAARGKRRRDTLELEI